MAKENNLIDLSSGGKEVLFGNGFLKLFCSFVWISKKWPKINLIIFIYLAIIVMSSIVGLLYELKNNPNIDSHRLSQIIMVYIIFFMATQKSITIFRNVNSVLKLLDCACTDFLISRQGLLENENCLRFKKHNTILFNCLIYLTCFAVCMWIAFPVFYNFTIANSDGIEGMNILNFYYPISDQTYNGYFYLIYIIEASYVVLVLPYFLGFDVFYFSLCLAIAYHYKIITSGLTEFGHDSNKKSDEMCEELKTIILKYQKLHLYMREFCSIVRFNVLLNVAAYAGLLITCCYSIALIFTIHSINYIDLLKLVASYVSFAVQLFVYLYFLDQMIEERDGLNFGLHSCNWTALDIQFKKMLLCAMTMNSANQLKIQYTPEQIVDLKLFLKVIRTSFSVANFIWTFSH